MAYGFAVKIFQPTAHYRIPFTYSRRHTYPIPPYSTVIGMLANLLRIRSQEEDFFKHLLKTRIAVAGMFESRPTEYLWFRNLAVEQHKARFGSTNRRLLQGVPEHPGGQSPVRMDVLEHVTTWLVFAHEDKDFVTHLYQSFQHPQPRDVLHLGRAEDWVILEEIEEPRKVLDFVEEDSVGGFVPWFHWIPEPESLWVPPWVKRSEKWATQWKEIGGLRQRITTFYRIHEGRRVFATVEVKLVHGNWLPDFPRLLLKGTDVPVWFWNASPDVLRLFESGV